MKTELEKELETQTGMSRWWEENEHGYTYFIRCPCGLAYEAIAKSEVGDSPVSNGHTPIHALDRFRLQYPGCPHLEPYEELLSSWNLLFIEGQCHERC